MEVKSLTYTSLASLDLEVPDLEAIHHRSRALNALNGVTGLLLFNGKHFLQIVEGGEAAIDDLVERLRRDRRHSALEIRDVRRVEARSFPGWSMELVRVSASYFEAKETVADLLPAGVDAEVRQLLDRFTEAVSGTLRL